MFFFTCIGTLELIGDRTELLEKLVGEVTLLKTFFLWISFEPLVRELLDEIWLRIGFREIEF